MANSRIRAKVRRRKVAQLAAYNRQFDVRNHLRKLGNPELIEFKYDNDSIPRTAIKQNGKTYVREGFGTIYLPRGVDDNGNPQAPFEFKQHGRYLLVSDKPDKLGMRMHIPDRSYENTRHKQVKNVRGKYSYTIHKLNKVEYMEKLVEHKTAKWERKNPKPLDMFTKEIEKWKQQRENAIERIRDFVVSVYDHLLLTGRFVLSKENNATYMEEKVAELKDINGEGHIVNALPKTSKLIKKAQKITDETKAKRPNLICTNLRDHKRKTGRILLPKAA